MPLIKKVAENKLFIKKLTFIIKKMPKSKTRKNHHEYRSPSNAVKSKKNRSAVVTGIIFFALIGVGIAFFASDSNPIWLTIGGVIGSIGGYYFGLEIDKSFAKK